MATVNERLHTDALITLLKAAGLTVGDAVAPNSAPPYVIVYSLDSGRDGPVSAPHDDSRMGWQTTCVGSSREQAQWLIDKVEATVLPATLTVVGRFVGHAMREPGRGVGRDDNTGGPPRFFATPRWSMWSTPA